MSLCGYLKIEFGELVTESEDDVVAKFMRFTESG